MCYFRTCWLNSEMTFAELPEVLLKLKEFELDGLLELERKQVIVTEKGKPFIKNICMAFDLLLQRKKPDTKLFSMTI
jgi:oxygen-independent coproporphyrinogen-3 oxidase